MSIQPTSSVMIHSTEVPNQTSARPKIQPGRLTKFVKKEPCIAGGITCSLFTFMLCFLGKRAIRFIPLSGIPALGLFFVGVLFNQDLNDQFRIQTNSKDVQGNDPTQNAKNTRCYRGKTMWA